MTASERIRKVATDLGLRVDDFDLGDGRTKGYTVSGLPGLAASVMVNDIGRTCVRVAGEKMFACDYIALIQREAR